MGQELVDTAVKGSISNVYQALDSRRNCRGILSMLAAQIGNLPQVREMVSSFPDRVRYPNRPMLTLYDGHPSVYLLGWREGDFTDVHDHGKCEVGIYVIQGVVTEDLYVPASQFENEGDQCNLRLAFSRNARQGDILSCPEQYIHRLGNVFPECAATLHVYGPVLDKMKIFSLIENRALKFDSCWGCTDDNAQH